MNPDESRLQYAFGDQLPALGSTMEIAPDVRWLRMPLPFALDHINLWLLRDRDASSGREGWAVIDCGVASDPTRAAWEQVFANELQGLPVLRVIVTHMHPDHVGLAHWLTARFGVRLWMSATDYGGARLASQSTTGFGGDNAAAFFASHGLTDPDSVEKVRRRSNYYASMVPQVPANFRRMMDGDELRIGAHRWKCHAGHGHSPEHIALHCEALGLLISGDMVLPRISTNVSVIDLEPEANPLPLYLASIGRMRALPADTLVLPSHGKPFTGLHTRIGQLHDHHRERLAEVMQAARTRPVSAYDVLPVLFKRPLDLHQTTFALGESVAHLHRLWHGGQLKRERDGDGIWRFAPA